MSVEAIPILMQYPINNKYLSEITTQYVLMYQYWLFVLTGIPWCNRVRCCRDIGALVLSLQLLCGSEILLTQKNLVYKASRYVVSIYLGESHEPNSRLLETEQASGRFTIVILLKRNLYKIDSTSVNFQWASIRIFN